MDIKDLEKLNKFEQIYKEIYLQSAEHFLTPVESWEDFKRRFPRKYGIPDEPPTPVDAILSETGWFGEKELDVAIVKNARYCPAFWHKLEFIKLVCVLKGSAILFYEDTQIELKEGDICIVVPGMRNALFSHEDADIVINVIVKYSTFENAFSSLLSNKTEFSVFFWNMLYTRKQNRILLLHKKDTYDMNGLIFQLYDEISDKKLQDSMMVKSYLMLIFGLMLRHYRFESLCGSQCEMDEKISSIIEYIEEQKQTVTLPEVAEYFKYSEGYMSRLIKKETGYSFINLLKEFRLKQAARMLMNSNCSIEEVCYGVGYADIGRFYRNFKERYEMTPLQYRQINQM